MKLPLAPSLARWRRATWRAATADRLGRHAAIAGFAAGATVLLVRAVWRIDYPLAALPVAALLVAPATAAWFARRAVPSERRAAAWLDVRGGAAGSVVTEDELGPSEWSARADEQVRRALEELPRARWGRALVIAAPALAFLALALWIRPPQIDVGPPPAVADAAIERLEEKLATLEEQVELEPEVKAEMQAQLEHVEAEAEAGRPESTFEALDRLEERIDERAEEALQASQRASNELAKATNDPDLAEAQAALQRALKQADDAGLAGALPKELQSALQPGSLELPKGMQLSSSELAKLSQSLKGVLDARLAKLAQSGLLDPKKLGELKELAKLGEFDPTHVCDEDCKKPGGT